MTRSGIYSITNTVTGHQYIGSAINLSKRKRELAARLAAMAVKKESKQ